jgi:hypothetical protein
MFEIDQQVVLRRQWTFSVFHGDYAHPRRSYYSRLPGAVVRIVNIFPAVGDKPELLAVTDDPYDVEHYRATIPSACVVPQMQQTRRQ